ncbi:glucosidase II beta subunit-like protein-domain-containing protein [Geopyxis carbonaria]|nr:glucosidase II beta subunit-like protein-domain-containing protein [Geopyxis carbonaria]
MFITRLILLQSCIQAVLCLFSIHDDILALPQYEIQFTTGFITEPDVEAIIAQSTSPGNPSYVESSASSDIIWLKGRKFFCSTPFVRPPPPMSPTEKEISKVEEEKELARATSRGWELLSDLEGKCLYFVSGWWSYSYCHNREVRQFHHLPPQRDNQWPPTQDPDTQSYILGQVSPENYKIAGERGEGTELQATGELRFLVQKLGSGTVCDLTNKHRKIEVQFHCNSHGTDRIGWIKEVTTCCYLMVIYTPRLCNDVAFLPPRENRANGISCQQMISSKEVESYEENKRSNPAGTGKLLETAAKRVLKQVYIDETAENDIVNPQKASEVDHVQF